MVRPENGEERAVISVSALEQHKRKRLYVRIPIQSALTTTATPIPTSGQPLCDPAHKALAALDHIEPVMKTVALVPVMLIARLLPKRAGKRLSLAWRNVGEATI
jgi:hypothetical protein